MAHRIVEIELTDPVHPVSVPAGRAGAALVFRHRDRPVGYALVDCDGPAELDRSTVRTAASGGGLAIVEALLDDEIPRPSERPWPDRSYTVAICTRDRPELLAICLQSILESRTQAGDGGAALDILVVDNAPSDDGTERLARSLGVRYAQEPRPGLDFGRNRALAETSTDVLAFIDDDVRVDRGWFAGLAAAFAREPDAGGVTGLVLPAELETDAQVMFERRGGFRRGFHRRRLGPGPLPGNGLFPSGAGIFGAGCNMAFDRRLLEELGGFDEALDTGPPLPGGGDLDMFYRVVRAGRPMAYAPEALVFHRHRREQEQLRRQYGSWGSGMMAFVHKSWRADPENRPQLARLVSWWCANQAKTLVREVLPREGPVDRDAVDLVRAEIVGGATGLAWEYQRSQRRSEQIRRAHP